MTGRATVARIAAIIEIFRSMALLQSWLYGNRDVPSAIRSTTRSRKALRSLVSHSHIVKTFHPSVARAVTPAASRSRLRATASRPAPSRDPGRRSCGSGLTRARTQEPVETGVWNTCRQTQSFHTSGWLPAASRSPLLYFSMTTPSALACVVFKGRARRLDAL